jgi:lysophospholipase L1-like esterase
MDDATDHRTGIHPATIPNNNEGNSTNIAPLNALIKANYAANNCDALADYWANAHIGIGSNVFDTTYLYDGLHMTAVGYGIMVSILAAQINSID